MAFRHEIQKHHLDRISAMLTRLGGRGCLVQEDGVLSNWERIDTDSDTYGILCVSGDSVVSIPTLNSSLTTHRREKGACARKSPVK